MPLAMPGMIAQGLRWLLKPDAPFRIAPRLDFALLELAVGKRAEHQAARIKAKHLATGAHQHRRAVAGIGVSKRFVFGVEQAVKERDEAVISDIAADDAIQLGAHRSRREIDCRKGFDRRLHVRHQQRRRHPFAADIGDANRRTVIVKLQHVEVIAGDGARRSPCGSHLAPVDLRNHLRQQPFLNQSRFGQFAFLAFEVKVTDARSDLLCRNVEKFHVVGIEAVACAFADDAE